MPLLDQRAARLVAVTVLSLVSIIAAGAGDPQAGQSISVPCSACHGQDGNSVIPGTPHLAGQNERYLFRQLQLMKSGVRNAPLMAGQLDRLSDDDLRNLSAYYAAMAPSVGQSADEKLRVAAAIYRGGIMEKGVAACSSCHAPDGSGNELAGFPRVSGQALEYTIEQLKAYREEERETDEDYGGMMRAVATNLTDNEIRALANYLVGLH